MEKTLKVINELKKRKLFNDYAIGGGIAVLYYVEPILTYDLDIFFIPKRGCKKIMVLSPIYQFLKAKGYTVDKEHIIIEGIPVLFLPAYNDLIKEAFESAIESKYKGVKIKVFKPEFLIAIMLQTFRPKDKERIIKMLDEAELDNVLLTKILKKFCLKKKLEHFKKIYYGG